MRIYANLDREGVSKRPYCAPARRLTVFNPTWAVLLTLMTTVPAMAGTGQTPAPIPATLLGQTDPTKPMTVALTLPLRDPEGARDFVARVTQPGNPLFHHYISTKDFSTRFGASQADYDAVVAWAVAQGLTVGERYSARTVIAVTGSVAAMQAALGIRFSDFRDATGRIFYSADDKPILPAAIAGKIGSVIGLSSAAQGRPLVRMSPHGMHPNSSGTGPGGGYAAADLRSIYQVPELSFGAKSQTLAVFETGGFTYDDVAKYARQNRLPRVPATLRGVDGYLGGINNPQVALEAVLDVDMLIAMNPAAKNVLVYEDGLDTFQVALLDSLSAMATDDAATSISISYGEDEALQGADAIAAEDTVLTQLTAQGQAVFASSGDDGAFGNQTNPLNVADPASQPFVTGVGGTTLFNRSHESYFDEEVWNDLEAGAGASGGGISTIWPLPQYQRFRELKHGQSVALQNGGSGKFRNVPDVASVANPLTGVAIYDGFLGGWLTVGGTSASAPLWAGYYSLASTASEAFGLGRIGFANPLLYTFPHALAVLQPAYHDVADGTNGVVENGHLFGFAAGLGYDNATGNGSFMGFNTLTDLALAPTLLETNPPPPPTRIQATATSNTATLFWANARGATGYFVELQNQTTFKTSHALTLNSTVTFTGLAPDTLYAYLIASISPGGFTGSAFAGIITPPSR